MGTWKMSRRDKRLGFVVGDYAVAGMEQVCRASWSWFAGLDGAVVTDGAHGQADFVTRVGACGW